MDDLPQNDDRLRKTSKEEKIELPPLPKVKLPSATDSTELSSQIEKEATYLSHPAPQLPPAIKLPEIKIQSANIPTKLSSQIETESKYISNITQQLPPTEKKPVLPTLPEVKLSPASSPSKLSSQIEAESEYIGQHQSDFERLPENALMKAAKQIGMNKDKQIAAHKRKQTINERQSRVSERAKYKKAGHRESLGLPSLPDIGNQIGYDDNIQQQTSSINAPQRQSVNQNNVQILQLLKTIDRNVKDILNKINELKSGGVPMQLY